MAVYFIQAGENGPIKIGFAVDPRERRDNLQTAHYETLMLLGATPGGLIRERELHHLVRASRIRNEWFHPSQEVLDLVATASTDIAEAMSQTYTHLTTHREHKIVLRRQRTQAREKEHVRLQEQRHQERHAAWLERLGRDPKAHKEAIRTLHSTLTVEDIERTIASSGDIGRAAVALGCSRRTLQLHMRQLGMAPGRGGRRKQPKVEPPPAP